MLGANGADVEVGIADPSTSCSQWITNLAGTGLVWNFISQMVPPGESGSADQETMQQACDLTDGTQELYVEDEGGQSYGDSICSQEEQNSWTPESSPGPLAMQAQQQASANASASAAAAQQQAQAQASAASAAAQASASSQASAGDGQLNQDVGQLGTDYKSWKTDVATATSDYQRVLSEPLCSGGTIDQNTYDDAQNVYDDGQSVYDDESTLTNDISAAQGDISSLQSAESAAGTTQYNGDISAAQAAIAKAQAAVSADDSSKIQNEAEAVQNKVDAASC
jgi:hypothetical protein